jgi:hypothetical protein
VRRATRVPQEGVSNGQLRSPLTTAERRSRARPGHHCRVPKLMINAVPPAGLRSGMGPGWVGHQGGAVSRHVGARGVANQEPAPRQTRRRDGIPALAPLVLRQADPRLHPSLHQRPRTVGNVLGPGSRDEVTSWTTVDSREA